MPDSGFTLEGIFSSPRLRIIPTGDITPPYKRDVGAKHAQGNILAFLDDDTYPAKSWLSEAVKLFNDNENIGCVCGPAVTPENDSLRQKASGLVYSSILISGNHAFRYIPKKKREALDFPSCNLLIRKDLFEEVGGFDKPFWPGEDTFLCLKILETKKKIVYDPKVLVFHHRRKMFGGHLCQIKAYAFHRGYFAKKYPENSLKIEYFIPSIFVLGILGGGVLSLLFPGFGIIYFTLVSIYLSIAAIGGLMLILKEKQVFRDRIKLLFMTISGIILTHFTYGIYFIKGLFAKKMPEE